MSLKEPHPVGLESFPALPFHSPPQRVRFTRGCRLLERQAYAAVFARSQRQTGRYFICLVGASQSSPAPSRDSSCASARLGLAIARKHARRAVDRNRVKRVVREAFRVRRSRLPAKDLVILSRPGIAQASSTALRAEIDHLLENVR